MEPRNLHAKQETEGEARTEEGADLDFKMLPASLISGPHNVAWTHLWELMAGRSFLQNVARVSPDSWGLSGQPWRRTYIGLNAR